MSAIAQPWHRRHIVKLAIATSLLAGVAIGGAMAQYSFRRQVYEPQQQVLLQTTAKVLNTLDIDNLVAAALDEQDFKIQPTKTGGFSYTAANADNPIPFRFYDAYRPSDVVDFPALIQETMPGENGAYLPGITIAIPKVSQEACIDLIGYISPLVYQQHRTTVEFPDGTNILFPMPMTQILTYCQGTQPLKLHIATGTALKKP